jgi:hypothetical protein
MATSIRELLQEADDKRSEAEAAFAQAKEDRALARKRCADTHDVIRDRILAGESSGDAIYDLLIVTRKTDEYEYFVSAYRAAEESLRGHVGEYVVHVVDRIEDERIRHVFGRGWETRVRQVCDIFVGILDSEKLVVDLSKKSVSLVTSGHAYLSWSEMGLYVNVGWSKDHLPLSFHLVPTDARREKMQNYGRYTGRVGARLFAGDDAIAAWQGANIDTFGLHHLHALRDVKKHLAHIGIPFPTKIGKPKQEPILY